MDKAKLLVQKRKAQKIWDDLQSIGEDLASFAKLRTPEEGESDSRQDRTDSTNDTEVTDNKIREAIVLLTSQLEALSTADTTENRADAEGRLARVREIDREFRTRPGGKRAMLKNALTKAVKFLGNKARGAATPSSHSGGGQPVNKWGFMDAGNGAKNVMKAIRGISSSVKGVGTDALKWINKRWAKLHGVMTKLSKWPGKLLSAGGTMMSWLGTALKIGMLLPSVWDMIKKLDKQLRAQYGENYIQDFLKKTWDTVLPIVMKELTELGEKFLEWGKVVFAWIGDKFKEVRDWIGGQYNEIKDWFSTKTDALIEAIVPEWMKAKKEKAAETTQPNQGGAPAAGGGSTTVNASVAPSQMNNVMMQYAASSNYAAGPKKQTVTNISSDLSKTQNVSVTPQTAKILEQNGVTVASNVVKPVAPPVTGTGPVTAKAPQRPPMDAGASGNSAQAAPANDKPTTPVSGLPSQPNNDGFNILNQPQGLSLGS